MYYAKKVYKNNIFYGCIRDPETIINDFKKDIEKLVPVFSGTNNKNRLFITFINDDTKTFYELPIDYKF